MELVLVVSWTIDKHDRFAHDSYHFSCNWVRRPQRLASVKVDDLDLSVSVPWDQALIIHGHTDDINGSCTVDQHPCLEIPDSTYTINREEEERKDVCWSQSSFHQLCYPEY